MSQTARGKESNHVTLGLGDKTVDEHLAAAKAELEAIEALPKSERDFRTVLVALDNARARLSNAIEFEGGVLKYVHTNKARREECRKVSEMLEGFENDIWKRKGLYQAVTTVSELDETLSSEEARFLEQALLNFSRGGLSLGTADRKRLAVIDTALIEMGDRYDQNITDDNLVIHLMEHELLGLPRDFLKTLDRLERVYVVPVKVGSMVRIMSECTVDSTRNKMCWAWYSRAGATNVPLLEELLKLRAEKAQLLGYQNFAQFQMANRMAKAPVTVEDFYEELLPGLKAKALAESGFLSEHKQAETGDPEAQLARWGLSYYKTMATNAASGIDQDELRAHFSLWPLTDRLFTLLGSLFDIDFAEVTSNAENHGLPEVWHDEVRLFALSNRGEEEVIGHIYLDLLPRDGKYEHQMAYSIRGRKEWADSRVTTPVTALICNFNSPTSDGPSLLTHANVRHYLHEMGHALHGVLSKTALFSQSCTRVSRDAVEIMSQAIELLGWNPDVLALLGEHYVTGNPLPRSVIEGLVSTKNVCSGLITLEGVFSGQMDLKYHMSSTGEIDTTAMATELYGETCIFPGVKGLPRQAGFGHLSGSYAAGYYGYLWSLVFAADVAEQLQSLDPIVGNRYRTSILARGGSRDEMEMLTDFLGRTPNSAAFMRQLGLAESA